MEPTTARHPSAMVDRIGPLTLRLLSWLLSAVVFPKRYIDSLRDAHDRGTVVFVMKQRSLLDYLYFNVTFLRERMPLTRFANGINTWAIRPFWPGLRQRLRGRIGQPTDRIALARVVQEGAPALLFLRTSRRRRARDGQDVLALLETLLQAQRAQDKPILLQPQLLIWSRRPERERPALVDAVLGTPQGLSVLGKAVAVFQSIWQAFLNLGAPSVQISSAINLKEVVDNGAERTDRDLARDLIDELNDTLLREERVVHGPWVKGSGQMRDEILSDPRTRESLARLSPDPAARTGQVRKARKILKEIAADFHLIAIKLLSSVLTFVWNRIYDGFEIDFEGFDKLRRTAMDHRIVLVPSHKSHVDYLVLSYVFYQNGMIPPHIAAGINLSFWPMGPIFRRSGAFFLRRSFSDDPLYGALFQAYLTKVIEEGFPIEFFIEGTRSRTGKLNPPKYGMLNMIVQAYLAGNVRKLAFVPVSVGYEKIIEGSSYRQELEGAEKRSEGIGDLLKAPAVLRSRYGRVYVEFGEPIAIDPFLHRYHPEIEEETPPIDELNRTVRRLAYRIIHGINDVTTVTPSAIAALLILNHTDATIDRPTLLRQSGFVLRFLHARHARLSRVLREALGPVAFHGSSNLTPEEEADYDQALGESIADVLDEALRLLGDNKLILMDTRGRYPSWHAPADRRAELAYYKNNILHFFVPEAVFATALMMNDTDASAPVDEVAERARFLSSLLKYEFCFEDRSRFADVFGQSRHIFRTSGWMEDEGDSLTVHSPPPPAVEFLRGLALTTLEAYRFVAMMLNEEALDWIDSKVFARRSLQRARGLLEDRTLLFSESVNRPALDNALRVLRDWGLCEERRDGRRKLLRVHPDARRDQLPFLVEALSLRTRPQHRDPDAQLSGGPPKSPLALPH